MLLSNATPDEIVQISRFLKQSHSPGIDKSDLTLAKIPVSVIAHVLAAIINCSFNSGIFPDALNIAKVQTIEKKVLYINPIPRKISWTTDQYQFFRISQNSLRKPCLNSALSRRTNLASVKATQNTYLFHSYTPKSLIPWTRDNLQLG